MARSPALDDTEPNGLGLPESEARYRRVVALIELNFLSTASAS
jgi:hypothetical protein